jgi:uncharacterized membrane protein YqaE (UPF0057 family)
MIRANLKPLLAFALLTCVLFFNFQTNFAGIAPDKMFSNWQLNGQARVLGGIVADIHGLEKEGVNMGRVYYEGTIPGDVPLELRWQATYEIFADFPFGTDVVFDRYPTQFGLQQVAYSWLVRNFNLTRLEQIQSVTALLSAIGLAALGVLYWQRMDPLFATLFIIFMGAMPFCITMGRNLYWSPFLMWLPAILSLFLYRAESWTVRMTLLFSISGAMFLKSASNYEYITTVTMLAMATFLVVPFFDAGRRPDLVMATAVGLACVVGFAAALVMHAGARGDSILDGLVTIYTEDISRRTYGDASHYSGETRESLEATPLDVLRMYFFDSYPSKREMIVPGKLFLFMIGFSMFGLLHKALRRHPFFWRDMNLLMVFFLVPASWFILAKGHSFTQTHINIILWYFGFMPALVFSTISTARALFTDIITGLQRALTRLDFFSDRK